MWWMGFEYIDEFWFGLVGGCLYNVWDKIELFCFVSILVRGFKEDLFFVSIDWEEFIW